MSNGKHIFVLLVAVVCFAIAARLVVRWSKSGLFDEKSRVLYQAVADAVASGAHE
jgi:hypothetical protein